MDKSELLTLAREYADKNEDLYALLGIDAITAKEEKEVQRAYRKQSIKYHPDKTGSSFSPEKWQLLERGRDVLSNSAARDVYDSMRSAALIREQQRQAMNTKRRTMIEDLEARERGDTPKRMKHDQANGMSEAERKLLAARGQKRAEERQRLMEEAEERMRKAEVAKTQAQPQSGSVDYAQEKATVEAAEGDPYESEIADLERSLREVQERKKASKKMRKSDVRPPTSLDATSQAQATPTKPPNVSGSKADEKKVFSFSTPKSTTTETSTPPAKGDFSATMARLRAAQAEKDRIKAAEAAASPRQSETTWQK